MSGCQGVKASGWQGVRVAGWQGVRVSGCQGIRASGWQGGRWQGYSGGRSPCPCPRTSQPAPSPHRFRVRACLPGPVCLYLPAALVGCAHVITAGVRTCHPHYVMTALNCCLACCEIQSLLTLCLPLPCPTFLLPLLPLLRPVVSLRPAPSIARAHALSSLTLPSINEVGGRRPYHHHPPATASYCHHHPPATACYCHHHSPATACYCHHHPPATASYCHHHPPAAACYCYCLPASCLPARPAIVTACSRPATACPAPACLSSFHVLTLGGSSG